MCRKKSKEQELFKTSKIFYASLLENSCEVKSCFLPDGTIVYGNPVVTRYLGYTPQEFVASKIFELVHPADISKMMKGVKQVITNQEKSFYVQQRVLHKNGTWRWMDGVIINLLNDRGVKGLLYSCIDVTEQRETIKRLESFNCTVSHDLQSPLCAVSNFSKILVDRYANTLDDLGKKYLGIIDGNVKQMIQLTRDLLEFSKLSEDAISPQNADMNEIVEVVRNEIKINCQNLKTDIRLHKLKPAYCDPRYIKLVWRNLISNAVKYSSKKSNPVVEIGMKKINTREVYYVKDNGAGFNMQYAGRLFEIFQRMHNENEYEGTGLGLATVHKIISKHGGRIWANAKENEGARFYFTLNS